MLAGDDASRFARRLKGGQGDAYALRFGLEILGRTGPDSEDLAQSRARHAVDRGLLFTVGGGA